MKESIGNHTFICDVGPRGMDIINNVWMDLDSQHYYFAPNAAYPRTSFFQFANYSTGTEDLSGSFLPTEGCFGLTHDKKYNIKWTDDTGNPEVANELVYLAAGTMNRKYILVKIEYCTYNNYEMGSRTWYYNSNKSDCHGMGPIKGHQKSFQMIDCFSGKVEYNGTFTVNHLPCHGELTSPAETISFAFGMESKTTMQLTYSNHSTATLSRRTVD